MDNLLSLEHIAAWVPGTRTLGRHTRYEAAAPPALQRGAVWKAGQIEALWDSIIRGFPMGAVLLTPFNHKRCKQEFSNSTGTREGDPTHHLLDGQQRVNAIALGFINPWKDRQADKIEPGAILWVDLDSPPEDDDREYIFRLITRSQPWGYARGDSGETRRIRVEKIRSAKKEFDIIFPDEARKKISEIPLRYFWPADSKIPVPMPLIIEAAKMKNYSIESIRESVMALSIMRNGEVESPAWIRLLMQALDGRNHELHDRFISLIGRMKRQLDSETGYRIPVNFIEESVNRQEEGEHGRETDISESPKDPLETLFVRLNRGGTELQGEELMYSLLKSAWPEAMRIIEDQDHKLVSPSRYVVLTTRLVLAAEQETKNAQKKRKQSDQQRDQISYPLPATPSVAGFRRLIRNPDRFEKLQEIITATDKSMCSKATRVFSEAYGLLVPDLHGEDFGLPPVLVSEIGSKYPDALFLLARWIDRMHQSGHGVQNIPVRTHRKLLGFLTSICWFGTNKKKCVEAVWEDLQTCSEDRLPEFFSSRHFCKILSPSWDRIVLNPPVPPGVLRAHITKHIPEITDTAGWKTNWYTRMSPLLKNSELDSWYKSCFHEVSAGQTLNVQTVAENSWFAFINSFPFKNQLLMFAQRQWLTKWFPDYDHTRPELMEDVNRPWDWDHIHPRYFITGRWGIPDFLKSCHSSIGNLRAWPQELNRSSGEKAPGVKLVPDCADNRYDLFDQKTLLEASYISKPGDDIMEKFEHWKLTVPETLEPRYLSMADGFDVDHKFCQKLTKVIIDRMLAIYSEWYNTLCIHELMPDICNKMDSF